MRLRDELKGVGIGVEYVYDLLNGSFKEIIVDKAGQERRMTEFLESGEVIYSSIENLLDHSTKCYFNNGTLKREGINLREYPSNTSTIFYDNGIIAN